jgi:hypothetical protein
MVSVVITLFGLTTPYCCACPKPEPKFLMLYVIVYFYVHWVEVRGDCSFCWYWGNSWPTLLFSCHNIHLTTIHFQNYLIKQTYRRINLVSQAQVPPTETRGSLRQRQMNISANVLISSWSIQCFDWLISIHCCHDYHYDWYYLEMLCFQT